MAQIAVAASSQSNLGGDMRSVDPVALIGTIQVSFVLANDIAWRAGFEGPADLAHGQATADGEQPISIRATGRLFFDRDGTGTAARILLAELTPGTQLSAQDFLLA